MPRCELCNRTRPTVDVRKMPGREARRCKDKFACELARTNSDPYTATLTVTFPARTMNDAWETVAYLMNGPEMFPMTCEKIEDPNGNVARTKDEALNGGRPRRDALTAK